MKIESIVLVIISWCFILVGEAAGSDFAICTDAGDQWEPSMSGNIVVWAEKLGGNYSIYSYDLDTSTKYFVWGNAGELDDPSVSGDIVVWMDNGSNEIYGSYVAAGSPFPICIDEAEQDEPSISGDIVVWQDYRNGNYDIYGYDLSTDTEFPICTESGTQSHPAISGDIVVWQDSRGGEDIYGYDLSTSTEFPICTDGAVQANPSISGDIVVWEDYRNGFDIYGYDLSTSTEFPICTNAAYQFNPAISGNIVVWTDRRNVNYDIYGYDLSTSTEFAICTDAAIQVYPSVSGDIAVWQDYRNGDWDIYGSFVPPQKILTVAIEPGHIGIDTVDPNAGEHICDTKSTVDISAARFVSCPDVYKFDHWTGDVADPNSANTTIYMDSNKTVTAVFAATRNCGDECHPNDLPGDLNNDCIIDILDFSDFAYNWLVCTKPECD